MPDDGDHHRRNQQSERKGKARPLPKQRDVKMHSMTDDTEAQSQKGKNRKPDQEDTPPSQPRKNKGCRCRSAQRNLVQKWLSDSWRQLEVHNVKCVFVLRF